MNHEQLNGVFLGVVDCLNRNYEGTWSWKPNPADWTPGGHVVDEQSGLNFYACNAQHNKPHFTISAVAPRDKKNEVPYVVHNARVAINVSNAKTPQRIADEIITRLLPEWMPLFNKALEQIARSDEYHHTTESVAAEIAEIVGVKVDSRDPRKVSFYHSRHPIFAEKTSGADVFGDDVTLTLSLAHDDALTLLRYMTGK